MCSKEQESAVRRQRRNLAVFVALATAFYVLTMPGSYYRGDNFAPRTEAVLFLTEGRLGIPYVPDQPRSGFLENRGQYFFENDQRREMFSKYGLLNTFLYIPPLWVERTAKGVLPPMPVTETLLAFINIFNAMFFVVSMLYLYGLASLYSKKEWVRLTWGFTACFGSFLWYYLRAPALEVYQIPVVLGAVFHAIVFWRIRRALPGASPRRAWLNLAAAATACAVAVNLKTVFVIVCPLVAVFGLFAGNRRLKAVERIGENLRVHPGPYTCAMFLPMAIGCILLFWSNWYRFASPFDTGYSQWRTLEGRSVATFGLQFLPESIEGFFLKPGNENVWMHAPLLVLAVFGWRFLWRRRRAETVFIAATTLAFLLVVCLFSVWSSGWCYGPRYLIHSVAMALIPLIVVMDKLPAMRLTGRVALVTFATILLACSLVLNSAVNLLGYFPAIEAAGQYAQAEEQEIVRYVRTHPHTGQISFDLLLHHWGVREFPPMKVARALYGATREKDVAALAKVIAREATPDWWVLKWARARRAGQAGFHTMPQPVADY